MAELPPGFTLIDEPAGDTGSGPLVVTVAPNRRQAEVPPLPEGFTLIPDEAPTAMVGLQASNIGARQGLTFNFGDEIMAGLTTPIEMAIGAYKGTDAGKGIGQRISDAYSRGLEQERALVKKAETDAPAATIAGNIGGGLVTGGQLMKGGLTFMKGAPSITAGALEGAAYGALSGAGEGEGLEDRSWRALKGGAIGGGAGAALGAAGKAMAGKAADAAIPDTEALKLASKNAYARSEAAGVIVKPEPMRRFASEIQTELADFGYLPKLQTKVAGVLEEIDRVASGNVTLKNIDQMRKVANTLRKDQDASTRELGRRIVEKLDGTLDSLKLTDILTGNKTEGVRALQEARKFNHMARKSEVIEEALEKAANNAASSGTGGNIDNAIRQQFRSILNNPKARRGFSTAELSAIRQIVRGTAPQNALRMIGKLAPSGGLSILLNLGAAMQSGGATIPLAAAGAGAKAIADRATPKNVEQLSRIVRSGGELPALALTELQRLLLGTGARQIGQQSGAIQTR